MVGTSKILTVSYGTFSCTLEGYDDPFGAMREIAEYFRDLAADDRYFGAIPPQPDDETLKLLAQGELQKRLALQAEAAETEIEAEEIEAPKPRGRAARRAQMKAAAKARAMAPEGESIAAKMNRIRAAAARSVEEDADEATSESGLPSIAAAFADVAPAADDTPVALDEPLSEPADASDAADSDAAGHLGGIEAEVLPPEPVVAPPAPDAPRLVQARVVRTNRRHSHVDPEADAAKESAPAADVLRSALGAWGQDEALPEEAPTKEMAVAVETEDTSTPVEDQPAEVEEAVDAAADPEDDAILRAIRGVAEPEIAVSEDETGWAVTEPAEAEMDDLPEAQASDMGTEDAMDNVPPAEELAAEDAAAPVAAAEETDAEIVEEASPSHAEADAALGVQTDGLTTEDPADAGAEAEDAAPIWDDIPQIAATSEEPVEAAADEATEDEPVEVPPEASAEPPLLLVPAAMAEAPETDPAQAPLILTHDADPVWDTAAAATEGEEEADHTAAMLRAVGAALAGDAEEDLTGAVPDAWAEDLALETQAAEQNLFAAEAEAPEAEDVEALEDEDDAENMFEEPDSTLSEEDETALREELAEVEREVSEQRSGRDRRSLLQTHRNAESSVTRILRETESQLDDTDASRRRATIAHLKAAVAATRADRTGPETGPIGVSDPAMARYRDDLDRVVRPRRPGDGSVLTRPRKLAPLMLVSEQRIDLPTIDAPADVRPRRVMNGNLALVADQDGPVPAEFQDGGAIGEAMPLASYLEAAGVEGLGEMIEAAAAHNAFVLGRPSFARPQLMRELTSASGLRCSREDALRAFGVLLRQGTLVKLKRGHYVISKTSRFRPD